jgi:uncharacterized membrane protein YhhN
MAMLALTVVAAASAALATAAEYRGRRAGVYVFKPLATAAIVAVALVASASSPLPPSYGYLMLAGLTLSLAGDVFLMLPSDRFVPGLASFLAAHLCYTAAFTWHLARAGAEYGALSWLALAGLLLFAGAALWFLFPRLGVLKGPVLVYMLTIVAMAWQASNVWLAAPHAGAAPALAGALLFMASDTLLAFDRFGWPFRAAPIFVLGTYFPAQWLLARSIGPG